MLIIPSGFSQVTFLFTGVDVPTGAAVTLGLNQPNTASVADGLDLLEPLVETLHEAMAVSTVTLDRIRLKFGPNASGNFGERSIAAPGDQGADGAAPNLAVLVRKQTDEGGRQGRGRLYYPGVPEEVVNGAGVLTAGAVAQYQAAWDAFYTALDGADWTPVLLHSVAGNSPDEITSFVVESTTATQRRRLRR